MQKTPNGLLFSATDLVNFLECAHLTKLDLQSLSVPMQKAKDDEQAVLIQDKGDAHEKAYFNTLRSEHSSFIDIASVSKDVAVRQRATLQAMQDGIEIIFQATFLDAPFLGYADFLRRVESPSSLGSFSYEVLDTKLARSTKAKFVIQLACYSDMLTRIQGTPPQLMHVVLGDKREVAFRVADYAHYFASIKARFLEHVNQAQTGTTYPSPCERCDLCHWRDLCAQRWKDDDHLSQVANILKTQIRKLELAGVTTLEALAKMAPGKRIPKLPPPILSRLRHQASLQLRGRQTGKGIVELIQPDPESPPETGARGFARMPAPDRADLFFDMEGNPLEDGGLEYLFGLYFFENGKPRFKPFWAHTRAQERVAFESFMDFVTQHLARHPGAHIYHYAPYEVTALRKLMGLHGTRESEVDYLLRQHKMVDLYQVVREAIRVSEPAYSIKNIEHFYLEKRGGSVTNAGASIVYYEKWKQTQDAALLKAIADYNEDDVRSTYELQQWLLKLRPPDIAWVQHANAVAGEDPPAEMNEAELRLLNYRERLVGDLTDDETELGSEQQHRLLTFQLLDFHRRADKPQWWGVFDRQAMNAEDRLENPECIAQLQHPVHPPRTEARSLRHTLHYPEQELKIKTGDSCVLVDTLISVGTVIVDEEKRTVSFKIGARHSLPSEPFDIGLGKAIDKRVLQKALFRYADSLIDGADAGKRRKYPAIDALLTRELPRLEGHALGTPLAPERATVAQIFDAVNRLDQSYVFIQGPPGSGKTYTGARVILALLKAGKRVGVSSNSHKAIVKLLEEIESVALADQFRFRGAKKSDQSDPSQQIQGELIIDVWDKDSVFAGSYQLIAGTAWLFADEGLDQTLDYIFVDEAGQVALGMLVSMATSARNIVLLGDQMQLSQPIQGVHPGDSGLSSLDYLLEGRATIAPERGIFLGTTWRMHPKVCQFISDAVYDGRLHPEAGTAKRVLVLSKSGHPGLATAGIRYLPIRHEGCSQWSPQEVACVTDLYSSLLKESFTDGEGNVLPLTSENILVVSPYNMQVNKLKLALPEDARVGTVDKFQGQEAEVVIVSMATSSGEDLPRHIEFLYSKNRLNVAISRAKCLAILVASPALMEITCKTPEQMALVNTLCWLAAYSTNIEYRFGSSDYRVSPQQPNVHTGCGDFSGATNWQARAPGSANTSTDKL